MGNIMGNICCCKVEKDFDNNPLLKNTLYCVYCEHNLPFNEYYKHYVDCKNGFLNNNNKYGEL